MKKINQLRNKFAKEDSARWARWILIAAGVLLAAFLAASIETGKAFAQSVGFRFRGAIVRVITPNGDVKNDTAILCYENPKSSGATGTIFDLRGQTISGMTRVIDPTQPNLLLIIACRNKFPVQLFPPNMEAMTWDGKAGGTVVGSGVYIYQIKSEDTTVTGTVVVVR